MPAEQPADRLPVLPKTVRDTGLDRMLILELIAKTVSLYGKILLPMLASRLKLSINVLNEALGFMLSEHLIEVVRRGASDIDVEYQLTDAGKRRASELMARCRYVGPAPVTLNAYCTTVERHSVRFNHVTEHDINLAFSDLTLNSRVREQVGVAMNSGRPLFLYGPAGSGKTYLAERLGRLMHGSIIVPYAIVVEGEIIQVFDPMIHTIVPRASDEESLDARASDGRWVMCKRPIMLTGGELTLSMLELRYDYHTGFYQAPPHFKANGGIFIVDDLGRQQVAPQDLMNRWIVPLDRHHDHLILHTGHKFTVPFDVTVVFSTNLKPELLADDAFMRRLGYKIHIGTLSEGEYRSVLQQHGNAMGINYEESGFRYLVDELHATTGRPMLASYAHDLLRQVNDYARFRCEVPAMTSHSLSQAWQTYFAGQNEVFNT